MSEKVGSNQYAKIDMRIVSLYELLHWEEKGILKVESPNNRKLRWTAEGKSQLIESVLEGIPVQAVFLLEGTDGILEIIDGLQRIKTIVAFLKDEFCLISRNSKWDKCSFSQLGLIEQRRIEDFQIVVYIVRKDNEGAVEDIIFKRLNLNQQRYSSQEVRNYRYRDGAKMGRVAF